MVSSTLAQEFRVIDAHHAVYKRQQAQIGLLTLLLRIARGEYVSVQDRWKGTDILEEFPDLATLDPDNQIKRPSVI